MDILLGKTYTKRRWTLDKGVGVKKNILHEPSLKANAKVIKMLMFIQTLFKRTIGAYQLLFVFCSFIVLDEVMRREIRILFSFLIILAI